MGNSSKFKALLFYGLFFSAGAALGALLAWVYFSMPCRSAYLFINPELQCGNDSEHIIDKKSYTEFRERVSAYLNNAKQKGELINAGIYFRDLEEGPAFGINEDVSFVSASLLKLPIVLALFKLGDRYNDFLQRKLSPQGGFSLDAVEQFYKPSKSIEIGKEYSVEELMYNALVYSDNRSIEVLKKVAASVEGTDIIRETIFDIGFAKSANDIDPAVSPQTYAALFRLLFNASYLSKKDSDLVLTMLSKSEFHRGLRQGVPSEITIANKFGERISGANKQLNDCGIIYYPRNPYVLCVMTVGSDFAALERIIGTISEMTYKEVNARRLRVF